MVVVGAYENPIFIRYLPQIAGELLGRDLRLRTVASYWCGDSDDFKYVLDNLKQLVIKPVYRAPGSHSVYGGNLSSAKLQQLQAQLRQNPMHYVAQPVIRPSRLPTYDQTGLSARPSILRSFAVAGVSSYTVMPGGLTRVGNHENAFLISNQLGSLSKDTWIIHSEPVAAHVSSETDESISPVRDADLISLPSRVVENLFWMGRYAERAEASLRILRTVFMALNGEEPVSAISKQMLLTAVTDVTSTQANLPALLKNPEAELLRVVKDADQSGSVRSNLNAMLYSADESKELLSSDTLRVINDIRDALDYLDQSLQGGLASAPEEALDPLVTALMALSGLAHESMVRDLGWRFMDIGRRLERALQTTILVRALLVPETQENDQAILLQSLLLSVEALISYRRRYRARMGVQPTLDLVLMDTSNPRSLLHQLERLSEHIKQLPKAPETRHELLPEERSALQAESLIKLSLLSELSSRDDGQRMKLQRVMASVSKTLADISERISDKYFDHRETSQQLVSSLWENIQ